MESSEIITTFKWIIILKWREFILISKQILRSIYNLVIIYLHVILNAISNISYYIYVII